MLYKHASAVIQNVARVLLVAVGADVTQSSCNEEVCAIITSSCVFFVSVRY